MSETFLTRWARRKREAAEEARAPAPDESTSDSEAAPAPPDQDAAAATAAEAPGAPDLAKLPPLDSITAATDIRAFLTPGVPAELARAALRRAWVADPTIRDFVGIAENQWDFTVTGGTPGFGPLEASEEVRRLVARIVGDEPAEAPPPVPARTAEDLENTEVPTSSQNATRTADVENASSAPDAPSAIETEATIVQNSNNDDAVRHKGADMIDRKPGHGRALPR